MMSGTWSRPPSFVRWLLDGAGFGAFFGALLGLSTLVFQGDLIGLPLGAGLGLAYGLVFSVAGWVIGLVLVAVRLTRKKGSAIGYGVTVAAVAFPIGNVALGGPPEFLIVLLPAALASVVAIVRGRFYNQIHDATSDREAPIALE